MLDSNGPEKEDLTQDCIFTGLEKAVANCLVDVVNCFVSSGNANLTRANQHGNTLIHTITAIKGCDQATQILALFLNSDSKGYDINAMNLKKETPLHIACRNFYPPNIKLLIEHNAAINTLDFSSKTPLGILGLYLAKLVENEPPVHNPSYVMLSNYLNNPKLSDVTFIVEDQKYYAHRIVLCSHSVPFQCMLESGNWKETTQTEIQFNECSSKAFYLLLEFLYTGRSTLPLDNPNLALELLFLADKYLLKDLASFSERVLIKLLNQANMLELFDACTGLKSAQALEVCCMQFLVKYYSSMVADDKKKRETILLVVDRIHSLSN